MIIKCQKTETEQNWKKQRVTEHTILPSNIMKMIIVIFVKEEEALFMQVVRQQICMLKEYMEVEREFIDTSLENLKLGNIIEKPDGNVVNN